MRGTDSSAKACTPAAARRSTPSRSVKGWRNAISAWPLRRRFASSAVGAATFTIASAPHGSPSVAPASVYAASAKPAASPALGSTTTSTPAASRASVSWTSATRRSPAVDSLGTPTFMTRDAIASVGGPNPPTRAPRVAPAEPVRVVSPLRSSGDRVGGRAGPGGDDAHRRGRARKAGSLLAVVGDRRGGGRGDRRRQHRLLARPRGRPAPPHPLEVPRAARRADAAPGRAVLREARGEDGLLRPLHRRPARR